MTIARLLLFLAAYATAVALPGPGIASLVARVLARGLGGIPAYIAGFVLGDIIWFAAAATGLSAIAATFQPLVTVIRLAGAAYLLYLAFVFVTAPPFSPENEGIGTGPARNFSASLAVTLGNPKIIVFFMSIVPAILDIGELSIGTATTIAGLMALVLIAILGCYAVLANSARRFFQNRRAMRGLHLGSGAVMAGAAVAIATK